MCVSCLSVNAGKGWPLCFLVCDAFLCFVTFLYGVLGKVWSLTVSILDDLCLLSYFENLLL